MRARILARAAELCRKAFESPTCFCSHVRRGRSLLDRSIVKVDDVVQKSFGGLSPGKFKALPSSCKINQCYGLILSSCHPRDTKLVTDLPLNNLLRLKALDTFGSCQRPGFSLHMVYPNIYA